MGDLRKLIEAKCVCGATDDLRRIPGGEICRQCWEGMGQYKPFAFERLLPLRALAKREDG